MNPFFGENLLEDIFNARVKIVYESRHAGYFRNIFLRLGANLSKPSKTLKMLSASTRILSASAAIDEMTFHFNEAAKRIISVEIDNVNRLRKAAIHLPIKIEKSLWLNTLDTQINVVGVFIF